MDGTINYLQFHVHIIEAKHLKSRDESKSSDPFVKVCILDEQKSTEVLYDTMNCTWDKSLFFEFEDKPFDEIKTQKVSLTVYDSNTWRRNAIIGSYDLDIEYIMNNKIHKQWLVLTDPTDTYQGGQGFLNVSINIIQNGEKVEYENRLDELSNNELLIPTTMKQDEYSCVCILHCVHYGEEESLFVSLKFGNGHRCCSSIVCHENPVYNQQLQIPIIFPSMSDIVELSLICKNGLLETVLCSMYIYVSKMKRKRNTYPTWYHLYTHNDTIKKYKASLLANMYLQKVENAEYAVHDMIQQEGRMQLKKATSDTKQQHMLHIPLPLLHEYVVTCNLYECHNLNTHSFVSTRYSIVICYKEQIIESNPHYADKHGIIIFHEKIASSFHVEKSIQNQTHICMYLKQNEEYVGYCNIVLSDIVQVTQPQWVQLGQAHLLYSMLLYKKNHIPLRDPFLDTKLTEQKVYVNIYQGIFPRFGDFQIGVRIVHKQLHTSTLKEQSLCDWYESLCFTLMLPDNPILAPLVYMSIIVDNVIIETLHTQIHSSQNQYDFPVTKAHLQCDITHAPKQLKTIHKTYMSRFVLLGIRQLVHDTWSRKLSIRIKMNDELQHSQKVVSQYDVNIMEIFDFIVNQYAHDQYATLHIYTESPFCKKVGECIIPVVNTLHNDYEEENEEIENERDYIPKYLNHRKILRGELEHYYTSKQPFDHWPVRNIHKRTIGYITGYTRIFNTQDTSQRIISHENEKSVFQNEKVIVRVYILRCLHLVAKDMSGSSDPYVKLTYGKCTYKTHIIKQDLNPEFHTMFEFKANVPNDGFLNIDVYDWDMATSDDYIGGTFIDITNRWYHDEWNNFTYKPLELRTLYHNDAQGPQGTIEMWVDILSQQQAKVSKPIDISLPPMKPFVIRLIIWNAKKLACNDMNNMNDLFISGIFHDEKKCTDIHWRSSNRRANFNYRLLWDIELPMKRVYSKLTIQAWDQDIIGESDLIGEAVIDMNELFRKAYDTLLPQYYTDIGKDVWIELFHSDHPGISRGYVRVSLCVVTQFYATQHPAGEGRGEPNTNPTLQEPLRPSFQITKPLELIADVLGEEMYSKLKYTTLVACLCGPCLFLLWLWVQIKHAFGIKYSWE